MARFGDTTNSQATFRTDGRIEQLIAQLRLVFPIPVGWLHHGPASAPRGGGYVSTALGGGRVQHYSERNWGRRWMVESVGSGWWLELAV